MNLKLGNIKLYDLAVQYLEEEYGMRASHIQYGDVYIEELDEYFGLCHSFMEFERMGDSEGLHFEVIHEDDLSVTLYLFRYEYDDEVTVFKRNYKSLRGLKNRIDDIAFEYGIKGENN